MKGKVNLLSKFIGFALSLDMLNALDELRGNKSRSRYLRYLICEEAKRRGLKVTKTMEHESW